MPRAQDAQERPGTRIKSRFLFSFLSLAPDPWPLAPSFGGEGGIRTHGTPQGVQQISSLPPSTTRPPLRSTQLRSAYCQFTVLGAVVRPARPLCGRSREAMSTGHRLRHPLAHSATSPFNSTSFRTQSITLPGTVIRPEPPCTGARQREDTLSVFATPPARPLGHLSVQLNSVLSTCHGKHAPFQYSCLLHREFATTGRKTGA